MNAYTKTPSFFSIATQTFVVCLLVMLAWTPTQAQAQTKQRVENDGRTYIAVALSNSDKGADWLSRLIVAFDEAIVDTAGSPEASSAGVADLPVHPLRRTRWR